ncbi:hypothetical protein DPMN_058963 [Dreissena polymorpha]|uniref:Uncharacterized protein n=1 Tax=Dreissena polymorpha TaxID=45954 RepID=A0A9D4C320_DREPO|nr:hypothetical protein DPMN_058963 [Dreissena polymorpha]
MLFRFQNSAMKTVLFVCVCMTVLAVTQAFILGSDGMRNLMFMNAMRGRGLMDFGGLFGGGQAGATGGQAAGASNPLSSIMTLAMLGGEI